MPLMNKIRLFIWNQLIELLFILKYILLTLVYLISANILAIRFILPAFQSRKADV